MEKIGNMRWASAVLIALAFALQRPIACAAGTEATPSPPSLPAACTPIRQLSPSDAFAHDIDDKPTLRLIKRVMGAGPELRRSISTAMRTGLDPSVTSAIDNAAESGCFQPEIAYRTMRVVYSAEARWAERDPSTDEFNNASFYAAAALLLRDRLSSSSVDSALAPFGTTLTELSARLARRAAPTVPSPAPSPTADATPLRVIAETAKCAGGRDAAVTYKVMADFPAMAQARGESGRVMVKVALDDEGLMRAATLYNTTVSVQGGMPLITSSLTAAATSEYSPRIVECKPVGGDYLFVVEFVSR